MPQSSLLRQSSREPAPRPVILVVEGDPDTQELYRFAPVMQARLAELPEFQEVTSDLQLKSPLALGAEQKLEASCGTP